MNFRQLATSEFGTRLWVRLGQWLHPKTGHAVGRAAAGILSKRRSTALYQAIRTNQLHVRHCAVGEAELYRLVHGVMRYGGMVSYDMVRLVALGDDAIRQAITFDDEVSATLEDARSGGRGVVACGAHLSAFHLAIMGFALRDLPLLFLLANATPAGYSLVQQMVSRHRVQAVMVDSRSLREALRRLGRGEFVLTGVDWPEAPGDTLMLPFFGTPARLPTGHIRLAMHSNARLLPVAVRWDPGTGYRVMAAPALELELTGDRAVDIRHNALRVLAVIERWIAERPEQWAMYYPVWKEDDRTSFGSIG